MGALREYIIPLRSLQSGTHQFNWSVGSEFLKHFEASIITDGHFNVKMQLDNRDDVSVISLHFTGVMVQPVIAVLQILKFQSINPSRFM